MILSYLSDRTSLRFPFIVFGHILALAGCVTLLTLHHNRDAEYAAVCLYLMGTLTLFPLIVCWNVMNLEGHIQRAVGVGWQIGLGNLSGILAAWSFPSSGAPEYRLGYSLGIASLGLSLVMSTIYWLLCRAENKTRKLEGRKLLLL